METVVALLRRKEMPVTALLPVVAAQLSAITEPLVEMICAQRDGAALLARLVCALERGSEAGDGPLAVYQAASALHLQSLMAVISTSEAVAALVLSDASRVKLLAKQCPRLISPIAQLVFLLPAPLSAPSSLETLLHRIWSSQEPRVLTPAVKCPASDESLLLLWHAAHGMPSERAVGHLQQSLLAAAGSEIASGLATDGLGFYSQVDSPSFVRVRHLLLGMLLALHAPPLGEVPLPAGTAARLLELILVVVQKHFPILTDDDSRCRPGTAGARPGTGRTRPGTGSLSCTSAHIDPHGPGVLGALSDSVCQRLEAVARLAAGVLAAATSLAGLAQQDGLLQSHATKLWPEIEAALAMTDARAASLSVQLGAAEAAATADEPPLLLRCQLQRCEGDQRFLRQLQLDVLTAVVRLSGVAVIDSLNRAAACSPPCIVIGSPQQGNGAAALSHAMTRTLNAAERALTYDASNRDIGTASNQGQKNVHINVRLDSLTAAVGAVVDVLYRTVTVLLSAFASHEHGSPAAIAAFFSSIAAELPFLHPSVANAALVVGLRLLPELAAVAEERATDSMDDTLASSLIAVLRALHKCQSLLVMAGDAFLTSLNTRGLSPLAPIVFFGTLPDDALKKALKMTLQLLDRSTAQPAANSILLELAAMALRVSAVAMYSVDLDDPELANLAVASLLRAAVWAGNQRETCNVNCPNSPRSTAAPSSVVGLHFATPKARRAPLLFAAVSDALRALLEQQQLNLAIHVGPELLLGLLLEPPTPSNAATALDSSLRYTCVAAILGCHGESLIADGDLSRLQESLVRGLEGREVAAVAALKDILRRRQDTSLLFTPPMWVDRIFPSLVPIAAADSSSFATVAQDIVLNAPLQLMPPSAVFRVVGQLMASGASLGLQAADATFFFTSASLRRLYELVATPSPAARRVWSAGQMTSLEELVDHVVAPRVMPLVVRILAASAVVDAPPCVAACNVHQLLQVVAKLRPDAAAGALLQAMSGAECQWLLPLRLWTSIASVLPPLTDRQSYSGLAAPALALLQAVSGVVPPSLPSDLRDVEAAVAEIIVDRTEKQPVVLLAPLLLTSPDAASAGILHQLVGDDVFEEAAIEALTELETIALAELQQAEHEGSKDDAAMQEIVCQWIAEIFAAPLSGAGASETAVAGALLARSIGHWIMGVLLSLELTNGPAPSRSATAVASFFAAAASRPPLPYAFLAVRHAVLAAALVHACTGLPSPSVSLRVLRVSDYPTDGIVDPPIGGSITQGTRAALVLWQPVVERALRPPLGEAAKMSAFVFENFLRRSADPRVDPLLLKSLVALQPRLLASRP